MRIRSHNLKGLISQGDIELLYVLIVYLQISTIQELVKGLSTPPVKIAAPEKPSLIMNMKGWSTTKHVSGG